MKNTCVRHDIGSDFHAGHFLRDLLHEQGHDTVWLAEHTGCTMPFVTTLLEQPNMEAELFVRMGIPLEPLFFQRVDEVVFGSCPKTETNGIETKIVMQS